MGPVQPNLDVLFRERSLRGRRLLHVAHHHDYPVLLRQALDRLFEDLAHLDRGMLWEDDGHLSKTQQGTYSGFISLSGFGQQTYPLGD